MSGALLWSYAVYFVRLEGWYVLRIRQGIRKPDEGGDITERVVNVMYL